MGYEICSEHEGQIIQSGKHRFKIINGTRQWLTMPPDKYIDVDGISQVSRRENGSLRRE